MKKNKKHNVSQQEKTQTKSFGGIKFSWILFGAAAYYGLKYMNKRGILPAQAGRAVDWIGSGIDVVKQRAGIGATADQASANY